MVCVFQGLVFYFGLGVVWCHGMNINMRLKYIRCILGEFMFWFWVFSGFFSSSAFKSNTVHMP